MAASVTKARFKAALEFGQRAEQLKRCKFRIGRIKRVYRGGPTCMKSIQLVGAIICAGTAGTVCRHCCNYQFRENSAQGGAIQAKPAAFVRRHIMEQNVGAAKQTSQLIPVSGVMKVEGDTAFASVEVKEEPAVFERREDRREMGRADV